MMMPRYRRIVPESHHVIKSRTTSSRGLACVKLDVAIRRRGTYQWNVLEKPLHRSGTDSRHATSWQLERHTTSGDDRRRKCLTRCRKFKSRGRGRYCGVTNTSPAGSGKPGLCRMYTSVYHPDDSLNGISVKQLVVVKGSGRSVGGEKKGRLG